MALLKKKNEVVKELSDEKEKAAPKKEKKTPPKQAGQGQSLSAWLVQPALLVIITFVAVVAAIELTFLSSTEEQYSKSATETVALNLKARVDAYIKNQEGSIRAIAKQLSTIESRVKRAEAAELIEQSHADIERLYIVSSNQSQKINELFPDLSFASVDLIRKIFDKNKLAKEAFFHNKQWYFQIAAPISPAQDERPATLLAIFNLNEMENLFKPGSGPANGLTALVKSKGGQKIIGGGQGESSLAQLKPTTIPQWQVKFAPAADAIAKPDHLPLWLISGIAGILLAVLVYLIGRFHMTNIKNDLMLATQNLKNVLTQSTKKAQKNAYAEINSMVVNSSQSAKQAFKQLEQKQAKAAPVAATPEADQNDDVPLFEDDLLDLDALEPNLDANTNDASESSEGETMVQELEQLNVPQSIFRAYDIRGIVDETLNENTVELIGKALASEAITQGQTKLCVGYDGRLSSVPYCEAITRGIVSTGVDAVIIGQVPTPVLYFATHHLNTGSGVMITGSHNPGNYNGFKMMLAGNTLSGDDIQKLYQRITMQDFAEGQGTRSEESVDQAYLDYILNDIAIAAPLKVVVDAGNGVAGELAPRLIEELGCEVIPLFCDIDGSFPNHHPDPGKPENLQDLIAAVKEHDADIGLAFDGDGDRVGVVTNEGKIIWPDRLLMLFAKDVVSRNPGADIIFDVKCSRRLNGLISNYGGRPIMWKTGHSLIKAKMKETGALLAGEMSGHIFFKERWFGFDDGLYSAVRLLEILGIDDRPSELVFAAFPEDVSTPEINVTVTDESKFTIIEKLCMLKGNFTGGNVSTIDGLRVDYPNGWGLCRASNTTPVLVLRFEADDEAALEEIKTNFKTQLAAVEPSLDLNF